MKTTKYALTTVLGLVGLLAPRAVWANVTTYTYTGNPMNILYDLPAPQLGDNISGSFSLSAPLVGGLSDAVIELNGVGSLTSFNFSDGVYNYGLTSDGGATVAVSTNAAGQITQWAVSPGICCPAPSPGVFTTQDGLNNGYNVNGDFFIDAAGVAYNTNFAYNTEMPGTWTESTIGVTPEPASFLLFGSGMGLLGVIASLLRSKCGWRSV